MSYIVKRGDSLSRILKNLGAKNWASQSTWNLVKTKSGSPHAIGIGERLDLSRVPGTEAYKKANTVQTTKQTTTSNTPGGDLTKAAAATQAPMRKFEDAYGLEEDMMPRAYMQQFAAEKANPFALREAVRSMRDWGRGLGGGYHGSGYAQLSKQNRLTDVQTYQKELEDEYLKGQESLFGGWYGEQKTNYELDPSYELRKFAAPGLLGGQEFDPKKSFKNLTYNPYDVTRHFGGGVSGYGAAPNWNQLYGTVT